MDENGCEKTQSGLAVFVDKNLQIAERTASWIPSNVTRDQIIAMGDEIVRRERSMIVHYNGNKIGTGFIDNLNPRNLASAVWFCDYIINQYEREHRRNSDKFYKKSTDRLQRTIEKIFEGINHRNSRRALFKRDDCGHLRGDYGIIENGQKVGGDYMP